MESIWDEGENNSGKPGCLIIAGKRARQSKRAIAAEGETKKSGNRVDRQRPEPKCKQRKEQQSNSIVVFAKRERVPIRIEDVRVEEVQRVVKRLMEIPPKGPGNHVRIAFVRYCISQMNNPGPRHHGCEAAEADED